MTRRPMLRPAYIMLLAGGLLLLPPLALLQQGRDALLFQAEQRAARARQLTAAAALLQQQGALREQTRRLEQLSDEASLFHRGVDAAGIQIALLAQVRNLVQGAGLAIRSIDARAGEAVGGRLRLTVILSAAGPTEQAVAAIAALEAARPRLLVGRLRLLAGMEAGLVGSQDDPFLALEMEIDAYAQTPAS
ncbi:GspMb/PilO family protein [Niveispirillum sp. KHB5.9]|uniref:GspMb/PilO family protein n=1 Tax=Niveispirillum sp. KHB5.9 TaxID=3400269 RepID=UPI003A87F922